MKADGDSLVVSVPDSDLNLQNTHPVNFLVMGHLFWLQLFGSKVISLRICGSSVRGVLGWAKWFVPVTVQGPLQFLPRAGLDYLWF